MANFDFKLRLDADIAKLTKKLQEVKTTAQSVGQSAEQDLSIQADTHSLEILQTQLIDLQNELISLKQTQKQFHDHLREENKIHRANVQAAKQAAQEAAKAEREKIQAAKTAERERKAAAKEVERAEKALAKSIADEQKRIEQLRKQAEREAVREAQAAAKAKQQADREAAQTAKIIAKKIERERIQSEKNALQVAKQAAQDRAQVQQPPFQHNEITKSLNNIEKFTGFSALTMAADLATSALGKVKDGLQAIVQTTMQFDNIEKKIEYAFGAENAAKQLDFVKQTANELGLELISLAQEYGSFASATKELNISHEQTQQIFKGVASGAAAMGLSAEQAQGAFMALTQIAGKGKVSMEELRGQLSEHLPAAMSIAAKAMGVSTAELEKMVEAGLSAEVFLPKFGQAMEEAFSAQAQQNVNNLSGQINLLKNDFNELLNWLGENGVGDALTSLMKDVGAVLDTVQEKLKAFADSPIAGNLKDLLVNIWGLVKDIAVGMTEAFGDTFGLLNDLGNAILGVFGAEAQENFKDGELLVKSLNIGVAYLRDTFTALQAAFHAGSGVIKLALSSVLNGMAKVADKIPFLSKTADELEKAAQRMSDSAEASLNKAIEAALAYGQHTRQAWKTATESQAELIQRLADESATAYTQAQELAEKAAQARIIANAAIGTSNEETAKKAAEALEKEAAAAQQTAEKLAQDWQNAMGVIPPKVAEVAQKIDETTKKLADAKTAASGLGLDLQAAMTQPTQAMNMLLENMAKLETGFNALSENGYQAGLLLKGALDKAVDTAANQADIEALRQKYQALGEDGKLSALEVEQGFLALDLRLAEIQGSTDPIAKAFKQLGIESQETIALQLRQAESALQAVEQSGQASEQALEKARQKVLELKNAADPTADAFKQLGIKTKEAMLQAANEQIAAFEQVKASGQATQADLAKAFAQTAQAAIASGDQSAIAWVQSQAAAYQYKVVVDASGKANLQAAAETTAAATQQIAAHQQVAAAATQAAQAQSAAAAQTAADTDKVTQAASAGARKLSELGQKVHYTLKQTGAYATFGTANWANTIRSVQGMYINIHQTITRLNDEMEHGGNIAQWLAKAEMLAVSNAQKLDKTTLSNLHAAIDKARAKMRQMADDAANTKKALEKQLLNAQGNTSAVAEMEQREALNNLQKQLQIAEKAGNQNAVADYQKSIELQKRIYQTELDRQRAEAEQAKREAAEAAEAEARAKQEAERAQREAQREQAQRESRRAAPTFTLPEIRLPEPQLDLTALDLSHVNIDTSAISDALAQRDSANLAEIKKQLPQLINDLIPVIAQKLIEQMQKDVKRGQ